jgi:hypothetical protein
MSIAIDPDPQQVAIELSEYKRQLLLELIDLPFDGPDQGSAASYSADVLDGDRDENGHVLSLASLRADIAAYWAYFDPQLPLLHRPTFVPDSTPDLLLIAIITLGAACAAKAHNSAAPQKRARLADFLATRLRWQIMCHTAIRPPTKLWALQALLLLEMYEKMYSSRELHQRGSYYRATTTNLMRLGGLPFGISALDAELDAEPDAQAAPPGDVDGLPLGMTATTTDRRWYEWIMREASSRAAYAAIYIDVMHATMFGHPVTMSLQELQLQLPVDEALWSARSGDEVGRIEQILRANSIHRIRFRDALVQTLKKKAVSTNAFGRVVIMAGLLNIALHINRLHQQPTWLVSLLDVDERDRLAQTLKAACNFWDADFDEWIKKNRRAVGSEHAWPALHQQLGVVEGKNMLHHLAHMAMHVDIDDCHIYAGAQRLVGRAISRHEYVFAETRMKTWAKTPEAREATFHALQLLLSVLFCGSRSTAKVTVPGIGASSSASLRLASKTERPPSKGRRRRLPSRPKQPSSLLLPPLPPPPLPQAGSYSVSEDFVTNRPWLLNWAVLTVWSYGYALEGALAQEQLHLTLVEAQREMSNFLLRCDRVASPEALLHMRGLNRCVGLLVVVRDMFSKARWELLDEAAKLLTNCIDRLTGPAATGPTAPSTP